MIDPVAYDRWLTTPPDYDEPNVVYEREQAMKLLNEMESVAAALRAVLTGKGDDLDASTLHGSINGVGELIVSGAYEWDVLIDNRAVEYPVDPEADADWAADDRADREREER